MPAATLTSNAHNKHIEIRALQFDTYGQYSRDLGLIQAPRLNADRLKMMGETNVRPWEFP